MTRQRFVYLARASNGIYKIGWSANPAERVQQVGIEYGVVMDLVHTIKTPHATWLERHLHREYFPKINTGEWFNLNDKDVESIKSLTEEEIDVLHSEYKQPRSVSFPPELWRKAKLVCAVRGYRLQDYIVSLIERQIDHDFSVALKRMAEGEAPGN